MGRRAHVGIFQYAGRDCSRPYSGSVKNDAKQYTPLEIFAQNNSSQCPGGHGRGLHAIKVPLGTITSSQLSNAVFRLPRQHALISRHASFNRRVWRSLTSLRESGQTRNFWASARLNSSPQPGRDRSGRSSPLVTFRRTIKQHSFDADVFVKIFDMFQRESCTSDVRVLRGRTVSRKREMICLAQPRNLQEAGNS